MSAIPPVTSDSPSAAVSDLPAAERVGSRRAIVAATVGHAIEFYDYALFASFSAIISSVFFPESSATAGLLLTFSIYGVAYAARPFGAIVFGHLADRHGRRRALSAAILMMVCATVLIGITPGHASIGVWGALILCLCRVLQGISLGGELGGAMSYLVELAPPNRRGLYGSWQAFAAGCGLLGGALVGSIMTALLSEDAVQSWGWRLAFLLAAPAGLVGLYIRLKLEESPAFRALESKDAVSSAPAFELLRRHRRSLAIGLGIVVVFTVSTATWQVYMPAYLIKDVGLSANSALTVLAVALAVYVAAIPIIGHLSDIFGRRPIMICGTVGLIALSYPGFMALETGNLTLIHSVVPLIFVLMACITTTVPIVLAEYFPARVRSSGAGICYAATVAVLGGTAPLVQTWLTSSTGDPLSPAFYVMASGVVSLVLTLFVVRETARAALSV